MEFLLKRLGTNIITSVDKEQLVRWDALFLLLEDNDKKVNLSNLRGVDVSLSNSIKSGSTGVTLSLIIDASKSLTFSEKDDVCIIEINPQAKAKNFTGGFSLSDICSLINYGNVDIKGYPIFTENFRELKDNIKYYINAFNWGLPIV